MNFPDLKTCKSISDEFPESEYVWCSYASNMMHAVIRKRNEEPGSFQISSPTCEELGEWLAEWSRNKTNNRKTGNEGFLSFLKFTEILIDSVLSENETQARAEAVRLIIEPPSS